MNDKENRWTRSVSRLFAPSDGSPADDGKRPDRGSRPNVVIQATMLGSVGVGKTSLLAAMHEQFGKVVGKADLDIRPNGDTSRALGIAVAKLEELPTEVRVTAALEGTANVRHYEFDIGVPGRPAAFTLQMTDYPGRYLLPEPFQDREVVESTLANSDVILLAIDTPALVERDGKFHKTINASTVVTDELRRLLPRRPDEPVLLILALLKCETWVTTPADRARLIRNVKEHYKPLLEYIGSPGIRDRVGCVLTSVQTVGSVRLLRTEVRVAADGTEFPVFRFCASELDAKYAPVDTDQPLRWLLRFVINKYRSEARPTWRRVWEWLNGVDERLVASVDTFAAECKTSDGFEILQEHPLLMTPHLRGGGERALVRAKSRSRSTP